MMNIFVSDLNGFMDSGFELIQQLKTQSENPETDKFNYDRDIEYAKI